MNLQRAISLLAKFFAVDGEVFTRSLAKTTVIAWAQEIKDNTVEQLGDRYKLTQPQHAFLIGELAGF
jgi:hypothetical protein